MFHNFVRNVMGCGATSNEAADLYLDLMKRCVTNLIYDDDTDMILGKYRVDPGSNRYKLLESPPADAGRKYLGQIWPSRAHTMIGIPRLDNLQQCVVAVLENNVPGDLIETGVWRGGASIFMRAILKVYGVMNRKVWIANSFDGLPEPDARKYPLDADSDFHRHEVLAVSLEEVKSNFERYGLFDDQVCVLKGWFRDTLPNAPFKQLAVVRLDGDLYESTMDGLVHLYPKLSVGGYLIVDDYGAVQGCDRAVDDYRTRFNISSEIERIEGFGAFWQKTSAGG